MQMKILVIKKDLKILDNNNNNNNNHNNNNDNDNNNKNNDNDNPNYYCNFQIIIIADVVIQLNGPIQPHKTHYTEHTNNYILSTSKVLRKLLKMGFKIITWRASSLCDVQVGIHNTHTYIYIDIYIHDWCSMYAWTYNVWCFSVNCTLLPER